MDMKRLAQQYAAQNKPEGRAGNVFYEKGVIYSYGHHFPIAYIRGTRAFINSDRYSVSTSRQQSAVRSALSGFEHKLMNTADLKALISDERAGR
jgi:hypothetical protein